MEDVSDIYFDIKQYNMACLWNTESSEDYSHKDFGSLLDSNIEESKSSNFIPRSLTEVIKRKIHP